MRRIIVLRNALIINPHSETYGDIEIEDGIIRRIGHLSDINHDATVVDVGGRATMPGFIDVHVQGAGGSDVLDADPAALNTISRACAKFGVTGLLATTIYRPEKENRHISNVVEFSRNMAGARILGIHLEGPFISIEQRRMIHESAVTTPSIELVRHIIQECGGMLRMMTIAPELPGADKIINYLSASSIVPSFGHSSATYEKSIEAFEMGVGHVTHLFNAMEPMHHRSPGPIPAVFESKTVTVQIISDGIHVHPAMVRLAADNLGEDRCVLITDAVRSLGLPDGEYEYDGRKFIASGGVARYIDGTLIGTTLGMNELGRRFLTFTGWGLKALAKATSWNPARLLGMHKLKGSIEVGKHGDLVVLNPDFEVWLTIVMGDIVYSGTGANGL